MRPIIVLFLFLYMTTAYKLNVPKILLPRRISKAIPPINYTLEITDIGNGITGCFQWRSSRPELAAIYPLFDHKSTDGRQCANRAIVSAVGEQESRRTAIISAEDLHSGFNLRCDVIVDSIHSLEIVTTTRQLYLEDSPELFIVRAKNDEGDTFADLDGLAFDWTVESAPISVHHEGELAHQIPARIVAFAESEYETTSAIRKLEFEGLRGDRILVEGRSTGVALINVRARDEWKNVSPYSIQLTVMALLTLEPSADIRVPIGSRIHYSLKLIRYRKAETIPLPSPQYRIQLITVEAPSADPVARFDEKTSIFEALSLGAVQLKVEDRKLELASAIYELPSVYVWVVEPAAISFTVSTGAWVFEVGKSYDIHVVLVDAQGRQLYMAENVLMDVTFPTDLLQPTPLTEKNGTVWQVKTLKEGAGNIEAKHDTYLDMHGRRHTSNPVIHGQQNFEIFAPMSITPAMVIFPPCVEPHVNEIGVVQACFEQRLVVSGGSGRFIWSLENGNFSMLTRAKLQLHASGGRDAIISSFEDGPASIIAVVSDVKNRQHKAMAKVIVTNPTKAEFVDGPREVEIGSAIYLGLRVFGLVRQSEERLLPLTDCRRMNMDIRVSDNSALELTKADTVDEKKEETRDACVVLPFLAREIGDVIITVDIATRGSSGDQKLTVSAAISVYAPLKIASPLNNQLLITPTSSYAVTFTGGPRPLPNDPSTHFIAVERLGKTTTDYFEISPVTESSFMAEKLASHAFTTICVSGAAVPSEGSILISVGNRNSSSNKYPALSTATLKVICDFPDSLALRLKRKQRSHGDSTNLPPCPMDKTGNTDPKPVYAGAKFDLLAVVFDNQHRKFDNASAIQFLWHISDTSLVKAPSNRPHALRWRNSNELDTVFEFYESFHPTGQEGTTKVSVDVANVVEDACSTRARRSCEEFLKRSLRSSISLRLAFFATLIPSTVVLYNHPSSNVVITIHGGSGRFHISMERQEHDLISWTLLDAYQKLRLAPAGGINGETNLKVYDICLMESPPAEANIVVSSIEKLALVGPSLIMLGSKLTLRARAFDGLDRQFTNEDIFDILPVDIRLDGIGLNRQKQRDGPSGTFVFEAVEVGLAIVIASIVEPNSSRIIYSAPHRVQVFPAFEIEPREITLIAGARYQLRITGGLQHSPTSMFIDPVASGVTFALNDSKVISIGASGLIEAKRSGIASVTAHLANPENINEMLAQDTAIIHVVKLASVKIHAPTTVVYSGSVIPLSFIGIGDQAQFSQQPNYDNSAIVYPWGTCGADHPLKAMWSVDGDGAKIEFSSIDSVSGTTYLHCTAPGVVHIRLSAEQPSAEWAKLQLASGVIIHRSTLNASLALTIVDENRFDGPEGWRHDGVLPPQLLMSPNSKLDFTLTEQLRNQDFQIHTSDEKLLQVNRNGNIQAGSNVGDAVVVVTGIRMDTPDLNEKATVTISVQPISYLLPSTELWSVWKEQQWHQASYPVSYTLTFAINFYDDRGLRFNAVKWPRKVGIRSNRFDLTDISVTSERNKEIVVIRLKEVGETVVKIWDMDQPNTVFEYLRVNAVHAIHPAITEVQIGRRICFHNILRKTDSQHSWSSSDHNVIDIDSATGLAIAKSPGQAIISQTLQGKFTTATTISVVEPTSISISNVGPSKVFMDSDDDQEHVFAVNFDGDGYPPDCTTMATSEEMFTFHSFPFKCHFQISPPSPATEIFSIKEAYLSTSGFVCIVKRSTVPASGQTNNWGDNRNVSTWASRGSLFSEKLTYPIYAPLIIHPSGLLLLDNDASAKANLRVVAPSKERFDGIKLTLSMDARNLLEIGEVLPSRKESQVDVWKKDYVIYLKSDAVVDLTTFGGKSMDLHAAVVDEITKITQTIPIRLKLHSKVQVEDETKAIGILGMLWRFLLGAKEVYGNVVLIVVTAALTITSVYFGYRFLTNAAMRTSGAAAVPNYAPISPASIPWRSYGAQSMRTPQLWSLDRSQSSPSSADKTANLGESFVTRR